MRKLFGALAAVALAAPASSALAADIRLPVKAPVMAPVVYNWTGFYIGGNVGYSWGRVNTDLAATATTTTRTRVFRTAGPDLISDVTTVGLPVGIAGTGSTDVNGIIGGGQIGYNWQSGAWLFGLEADFQGSGEKKGGHTLTIAGVSASADFKLNWFGTARARLGWLPTDRVVFYVTGGLAYGALQSDYSIGFVGFPPIGISSKHTKAGYVVGGGVEGALGGNWTAKAEYLFMDLGSFDSGAATFASASTINLLNTPSTGFNTVTDTTVAATGSFNNRFRDHIFRVGLNYRFAPEPIVARY